MTTLIKVQLGFQTLKSFLQPKLDAVTLSNRGKMGCVGRPRKRFGPWLIKPTRATTNEELTKDNKNFLQEVIKDKYPQTDAYGSPSPLKLLTIEPNVEWKPKYQRTGVIAKKIGIHPMWLKDGTKILTTLFQVYDNHVIRYIPPEEYKPVINKRKDPRPSPHGCLLVGSVGADPQLFTKQYCGIFNESGVMPKKILSRFHISPEAALQPGTPLFASHFKVGQYVDVRGKTIDRGFQGVMKRWGFHGMPASHGVTKTHRRPGNIGSGGGKARVMPGTKMPGHMGNRYRVLRGQRIVRINTKYNVIWLYGQGTAGETNSFVVIYDTLLPLRSFKAVGVVPSFPTYFPNPDEDALPEEIIADDIFDFKESTIMYKEDE